MWDPHAAMMQSPCRNLMQPHLVFVRDWGVPPPPPLTPPLPMLCMAPMTCMASVMHASGVWEAKLQYIRGHLYIHEIQFPVSI